MASEVRLQFRYSEQDYARAVRAHYASKLKLKLDIFLVLATAAGGVYFSHTPDSRLYGIVLVALSVALAVILVAAFGLMPYILFRTQTKLQDEYVLVFSPEGVDFHTVHLDSRLQWSLYKEVLIDAHSYILYYGSRQFTVIPKQVFHDPQEQLGFENLLEENIAKIVRKDR